MENKLILGTVEKVELGSKVDFLDSSIEVWADIKEVSDNLQSKILEAVENTKAETTENMKYLYGRGWKETKVKSLTLHIIANEGSGLETEVRAYFEEVENPDAFESGRFEIDLSDYEQELKALIIKGITDKFF